MTEPTNEFIELPEELSDADKADLESMYGEQDIAVYHPILEVWREILSPENMESNKGVTMQWAVQICGSYPQMTYALMPAFHDIYFELLTELAQQVRDICEDDPDALKVADAAEDATLNHRHYKALLFSWQLTLQERELRWEPQAYEAPAEIAALAEVQKFFFSDRGLTAHLEVIKLEFTDVDQTELREALDAQREELK